jgi:hypothetical protein
MANAIYPKWKETALQGSSNLSTANVKVLLIDTNGGTPYTYSAAHQFLSDVPAGARVASSGNLASKTFTNATLTTVPSVPKVSADGKVEKEQTTGEVVEEVAKDAAAAPNPAPTRSSLAHAATPHLRRGQQMNGAPSQRSIFSFSAACGAK